MTKASPAFPESSSPPQATPGFSDSPRVCPCCPPASGLCSLPGRPVEVRSSPRGSSPNPALGSLHVIPQQPTKQVLYLPPFYDEETENGVECLSWSRTMRLGTGGIRLSTALSTNPPELAGGGGSSGAGNETRGSGWAPGPRALVPWPRPEVPDCIL